MYANEVFVEGRGSVWASSFFVWWQVFCNVDDNSINRRKNSDEKEKRNRT